MAIEINQTFAKIGIETSKSNLEINQKNATITTKQIRSNIHIKSELPKVTIDQYECFASSGLKNIFDLSKEFAQKGRQKALESISKNVSEGRQLAAIENGGNAIAEIAKRSMIKERQFGMVTMPSVAPQIDVTGSLEISFDDVGTGVEVDSTSASFGIDYEMAKVKTYLRQKPSIDIKYLGNNIDTYK
jgi:hypothetical protein